MDLYSQFISKSRYSRFLPEKNRREHWDESVARYCTYMTKHLKDNYNFEDAALMAEIQKYISDLEVMPSMRAIMTAGKALDRDNTAGYNCSYLPIDDPKAFDEAMYILLCGTGVGFSVEHKVC
jgi:ribonucleoside-triphosphate reductase (thioredoxin)